LRLIFRQLVDFIFSDYAQRLLCVEFPLTYMPGIGCAGGGHLGWSRDSKAEPPKPREAKSRAGWLALALAGSSHVGAVSVEQQQLPSASRRPKWVSKKRVNSRAKCAVRRVNIAMAVVVGGDGLRRG